MIRFKHCTDNAFFRLRNMYTYWWSSFHCICMYACLTYVYIASNFDIVSLVEVRYLPSIIFSAWKHLLESATLLGRLNILLFTEERFLAERNRGKFCLAPRKTLWKFISIKRIFQLFNSEMKKNRKRESLEN